jgi:hypothetical protein
MKYQAGQYIYSAKVITGWFDYSLKNEMPINTFGTIVKSSLIDGVPVYDVNFGKEFGFLLVEESYIKLG